MAQTPFRIGNNPGWYGQHYTDPQVHQLMKNAGNLSTRYFITFDQWEGYGMDTFTERIRSAHDMGMRHNTYAFTCQFHTDYKHRDTAKYPAGPTDIAKGITEVQTMLPKGLYKPALLADGSVNPENAFAVYVADGMRAHGAYFDYFEIWNEPDITYNSGDADDPNTAHQLNSWWNREPQPWEIYQLICRVKDYVQLCKVGFTVIKKMKPGSKVCTGGFGYPAFGYWFHKLGGGSWYDVLSIHLYPMYYTRRWENSAGGFVQHRHSDYALQRCLARVQQWRDILTQFGKSTKEIICTEMNLPRESYLEEMNYGAEMQTNWTIKVLLKFLQAGVSRTWLYVAGEVPDYKGPYGFEKMGLYHDLTDAGNIGQEKMAPQGIVCKVMWDLLENAVYDAKLTASLNLPERLDGVAMVRPDKKKVFILWAKTLADMDEASAWSYRFPPGMIKTKLRRVEKYGENKGAINISEVHTITGAPSYFVEQ